jgi:hypothetical protein
MAVPPPFRHRRTSCAAPVLITIKQVNHRAHLVQSIQHRACKSNLKKLSQTSSGNSRLIGTYKHKQIDQFQSPQFIKAAPNLIWVSFDGRRVKSVPCSEPPSPRRRSLSLLETKLLHRRCRQEPAPPLLSSTSITTDNHHRRQSLSRSPVPALQICRRFHLPAPRCPMLQFTVAAPQSTALFHRHGIHCRPH